MKININIIPAGAYNIDTTIKFDLNGNFITQTIAFLEQAIKMGYDITTPDTWINLYINPMNPMELFKFVKTLTKISKKERKEIKEAAEYYMFKVQTGKDMQEVFKYGNYNSKICNKVFKYMIQAEES